MQKNPKCDKNSKISSPSRRRLTIILPPKNEAESWAVPSTSKGSSNAELDDDVFVSESKALKKKLPPKINAASKAAGMTSLPSASRQPVPTMITENGQIVHNVTNLQNLTSAPMMNITDNNNNNDRIEDETIDINLLRQLYEFFPDACPKYLRQQCKGYNMDYFVLNNLISNILQTAGNYPKRMLASDFKKVDFNQVMLVVKELFPDADPDYFRQVFKEHNYDENFYDTFIIETLEKKNYPTLEKKLEKEKILSQLKQYTTNFNVENFVTLFPDPEKTFSDPARSIKVDWTSSDYACLVLRNIFNNTPVRIINSAYTSNNNNLYATAKYLKSLPKNSTTCMKTIRKIIKLPRPPNNIPLLQEAAYLLHETEVNNYITNKNNLLKEKRRMFKNDGMCQTCSCCFDEDLLPEEVVICEIGCKFCKACVVRSTEIAFADGKLDFSCLQNCPAFFNLITLQNIMPPNIFSKIAIKKSAQEVAAAGIQGLEFCPFCDFASIPPEGDKLFRCLNPECMQESCRKCKKPSHIPLKCNEIEYEENVKARIFVENQMTEALLRKCWKCGIKFFKEDGCNRMTCTCGAMTCYICGQKVNDYTHFNGLGGTDYKLCPLYSNTIELNKQNVLKAAETAKAEIGIHDNPEKLRSDPASDVVEHYLHRAKVVPREGYLNLLENLERLPQ